MNSKYLAVVAAVAVMLVAATAALTTAGNAFATYKSKNQAVSQVNDCGNGEAEGTGSTVPMGGAIDVFCQNLASQIQGEDNTASLTGEQS